MTGAPGPDTDDDLAERALILAAKQGQQPAYAALYDRHALRAFRSACLLLPDRMAAEDALQEAFTRAFSALHRFQPHRPFEPWLLRILVNECRRRSRKLQRERAELIHGQIDETYNSRAHADGGNRLPDLALRQAVAALSTLYREVIILHYYNDLSVSETARVLGCPAGTVKYRLFKARRRLATALQGTEE